MQLEPTLGDGTQIQVQDLVNILRHSIFMFKIRATDAAQKDFRGKV